MECRHKVAQVDVGRIRPVKRGRRRHDEPGKRHRHQLFEHAQVARTEQRCAIAGLTVRHGDLVDMHEAREAPDTRLPTHRVVHRPQRLGRLQRDGELEKHRESALDHRVHILWTAQRLFNQQLIVSITGENRSRTQHVACVRGHRGPREKEKTWWRTKAVLRPPNRSSGCGARAPRVPTGMSVTLHTTLGDIKVRERD